MPETPSTTPITASQDWIDRFAYGVRSYVIIGLLALLAVLPGVFSLPPLDRDESRFAQATSQMLESGDYVQIRFQDEARNKKPVGIYWLQAAAVKTLSSPLAHDIWAYRVPSVLGAILASLAALWGGSALLPRRAAFIGAALFAVCVLAGTEGMIAKTDSALCGFITLAMAALARLYAGKGAKPHALIFWAAFATAVLIKGPVAPLVLGFTLFALYAMERRTDWMKPLLWFPGPILAALMVTPWFIAIQQATGGAFLNEAVGGDLAPKLRGGQEGHFAPPGTHLLALILLGFPFILALPSALMGAYESVFCKSPIDPETKRGALFLLAWALPIWLLFELLPTKLVHYTLPAYPALALLAGWSLSKDEDRPLCRMAGQILFALSAILIFGVLAYAGALYGGRANMALYNGGVLAILGGVLALRGIGMNRKVTKQHTIFWAIGVALVWHGAAREGLAPRARDLWVAPRVNEALLDAGLHPRLSIGEPGPLVTIGYPEPSLVFLTRKDTVNQSAEAAYAKATLGAGAVIDKKALAGFQGALAARDLELATVSRVSGHDYSNGDEVDLVIGRIIQKQLIVGAPPAKSTR